MYRQGDVLLVPISKDEYEMEGFERKAPRHRRTPGLVLAEGEATGHHHRVVQKGRTTARIQRATVSASGQNVRVLAVPKGGAELVHEEHRTITLPAGRFMVVGQREFVPPAPAVRNRPSQASSRPVWD